MGKGEIKGVGDIVAKVTSFIGIVPCEKCKERQEKWNNLFPVKLKPRELTEEELMTYRQFQSTRTLRLSNDQRKWLCRTYADIFRVPYYEPCVNCDASPYLRMIDRLDKIVETYD